MQKQLLLQRVTHIASLPIHQVWRWLHSQEGMIIWVTLVGHVVLHMLLTLFMPLAYYSEQSGHDGNSYYVLAHHPVPDAPMYSLMRYKRIFFALAARALWPWDAHIGFAIIGFVGVALANLYLYRIASLYLASPLRIALVFAFSPYLFAAAHVALPDPVSVAMVLAAFYYFLKKQFAGLVICSALALLFKEVSAVSILALTVLLFQRDGWLRTTAYLTLVGLPMLIVALVYAVAWGDWLWFLKESRSTLIPAPFTLIGLATASQSPLIVRVDSVINLFILALLGYALWRLRHTHRTIVLFAAISALPLLFLDERQYASDFDMARQYMVVAPALIAFSGLVQKIPGWIFQFLLAGMMCYAMYYILSIATFFVTYKSDILRLLSLG